MQECNKCGACCVAPSISSIIPGTGKPKPAGERCFHLTEDNICSIFGKPERPKVCGNYKPDSAFCGNGFADAYRILTSLL